LLRAPAQRRHRWRWVYVEAHRALLLTSDKEAVTTGAAHTPHPQDSRTLRTAGTLQGVPPSCSGRRVAVWSGVCSSRPSGFGEAARRASSLRTWRWRLRRSACPSSPTIHPPYVPRPSAVDHLDRDMLQRLTCSRTATVVCPVCTSRSLRTERGWVTAVNARRSWGFGGEMEECYGQAAV
jgi:hypothetical protein